MRTRVCCLVLSIFGLHAVVAVGAPGATRGGDRVAVSIEEQLVRQLAEDETAGYAIVFRERPDLSAAYAMDWIARGRHVVRQLRDAAETSQARVHEHLHRSGAEFRSFWVDNVIVVERSDLDTVAGLQRFAEIAALRALPEVRLVEPVEMRAAEDMSFAAGPNLVQVRAPEVWALGFRGQAMVVAGIDSGVRYTHEALARQYRGNLGSGVYQHDHNWWDPGSGTPSPVDASGHGTHTMGTSVGDDGGSNRIGVAPQAQWIACRGCPGSSCPFAHLLECGEFLLAPWDLEQENADPDRRPHVVNNSWGDCGRSYDPIFQGMVDAWHAAGIEPVFANGNAQNCGYPQPPGCNTVGNPARYGSVLGVGSTGTSDGQYATHSNWGPTDDPRHDPPVGFATVKPNVVAPGVSIRSAGADGDARYFQATGTSMSAPHVTGLVALLWQAAPCLVGDSIRTADILMANASPIPFPSQCGGEGSGDLPNQATGWGEIDALRIVEAGIAACIPPGPGLRLLPDPLDLGATPVTQSAGPTSLTVGSFGTKPVTVRQVIVESGLPSDDPVPFALAGGSCPRVPFTLAQEESCTFDFLFLPGVRGPASSIVAIVSDAPSSPDLASLRGTGLPFLEFDPAGIEFFAVEVGDSGPPQTAVLRNIGTVAVSGLGFDLPASDFQLDAGDCGDFLPPGGSCSVEIVFAPLVAGLASATVAVASDHEAGTASLGLAGFGLGAGDPRTLLVSRATGFDGEKSNGVSILPSISGNGRYMAFRSQASNLHPDKADTIADVFVRDLLTHETLLASRASGPDGDKGNRASSSPSISTNGRAVAFESQADNLHPDKTDALSDIFVRNLETHETLLVSRASGPDGAKGNGSSFRPVTTSARSISADGSYVVFESVATNLHPDDADILRDVYVRHIETHETVLVSRASGPGGAKANAPSFNAVISADGRHVAFESHATNLHPDATDGIRDVFVRDLETHETILVSRASGPGGAKGNGTSTGPSISAYGRFVGFQSQADNLHPDDLDGVLDVFVRDLWTQETILVSRASGPAGAKGNAASQRAWISADGRLVVFESQARNLHSDDSDSTGDVFMRDLEAHETLLVSRAGGLHGAKGNGASGRASMSDLGHFVAFASAATNLHPDDPDTLPDIYVRALRGPLQAQAELVITPDSLDFGDVPVGVTAGPRSLVLISAGTETVTVSSLSGPGAPFALAAGTCAATPFTLEPTESCTLAMTFHPTSMGLAASAVTLTSDAPSSPQEVGLVGTGVASLAFEPPALGLGVVEVGTTGPPQTAILRNLGAAAATGLDFDLPGGDFAADTSACGHALPAGQDCAVDLTFMPSAMGPAEATLEVASDEPSASTRIVLSGHGVAPGEPRTNLVSRAGGPGGAKGDGNSILHRVSTLSADGRFVAFHSAATNLHPDDADAALDVFVRDLETQETVLASRASGAAGAKANRQSFMPSISADGRRVTFVSEATNLAAAAIIQTPQVYVRDLDTHETFLVSRGNGATAPAGNLPSFNPAISADGRFVAYESLATNVHPAKTDADVWDVFVRDLETQQLILVSRASGANGAKSNGTSGWASVSGDGRYVSFVSIGKNLHPDDTDDLFDVFLRDLETDETLLVSRAAGSDGAKGDNHSFSASISQDGSHLLFSSYATNLRPEATALTAQVFVRWRETHELQLASRAQGAAGAVADADALYPSISADGRYVAFLSNASNLHPDAISGVAHAYVRDLQDHATSLVSRASGTDGSAANGSSLQPWIAADGRAVAFASTATNLHPDDVDDTFDVFIRDWQGTGMGKHGREAP